MAKAGTQGPNTKLAMAAIALILLGIGWGIYTANPGGLVRAKTKEEVMAEKEAKKEEEIKAREEQRKKQRRGGGGH